MEFEILTTKRLNLRRLDPEVYKYVFNKYSDTEIKLFFGLSSDKELSKEREKLDKGISTFNKSFLLFQIIEKDSDKIIGWCGFHTWYVEHNRAEIGYALSENLQKSKGIMTEALFTIIEYGFKKMNLHRIEAFIGPDNIPSLKLIAKFNFTKEGVLREHYWKNSRMEDSVVYSLLKTENYGK
ncbi:GNAT family N-acetyltransferase [Pedobacter mendelii]|uniref:N-acetyltransferase n=1 Tax=Pedobacter mendelii TaxID=1908240 RepID=A0ABQ2BPU8_9SPHI|nr:GNAT family protein [Pedobacter mendelii]GGI29350.1 N-acetyltransferase [Pedobacter mendelii]